MCGGGGGGGSSHFNYRTAQPRVSLADECCVALLRSLPKAGRTAEFNLKLIMKYELCIEQVGNDLVNWGKWQSEHLGLFF